MLQQFLFPNLECVGTLKISETTCASMRLFLNDDKCEK